MKKILLGTTAIIAAGAFGANATAAEPITLGVGGNMQQWFGWVKQEEDGTQNFNDFGINSDTILEFTGETTLDNGWVIGVQVDLNTFDNNLSTSTDQSVATVATPFGTIQAGARTVKHDDLHNSAPDVGIGVKDVNRWTANPTSGWGDGNGAANSSRMRATGIDEIIGGPQASVNYESPALAGLVTLHGTYIPAVGALRIANETAAATDAFEVGANIGGDFGGTTVNVDAAMGRGGTTTTGTAAASTNAYSLGATVGFGPITIGASYLENKDIANNTTAGTAVSSQDGNAYDVGIQFDTGAWNFSLQHFVSEREGLVAVLAEETFTSTMLSARYTLGPGVQWRTTVFRGDKEGEEKTVDANNTDAVGVVTGLSLSF